MMLQHCACQTPISINFSVEKKASEPFITGVKTTIGTIGNDC